MLLSKYPFYHNIKKSTRPVFWREVRPDEVYKMVEICIKINKEYTRSISIKDSKKDSWWDEILKERFVSASSSSKQSFKLNYSLFFEHLLLWRESGRPTKKLIWLYKSESFEEFKEKLRMIILTTGQLLEIIDFAIVMQSNEKNHFVSKANWLDKLSHYLVIDPKYGSESKIKDEMGRYFPGIFNTFEFDILNNTIFNKTLGYDFNLIKLDQILTKYITGENNGTKI